MDSSGVIRVLPGIWAVGIMKLICTLFTEQRDQGGGPAATHSDVRSVETLEIETHPGSGTEEGQGEICIKMDLIGFQPPATGKMGHIGTQIFTQ